MKVLVAEDEHVIANTRIFLAFVVFIGIGIILGLNLSRKSFDFQPIEALRYE